MRFKVFRSAPIKIGAASADQSGPHVPQNERTVYVAVATSIEYYDYRDKARALTALADLEYKALLGGDC